VTFRKSTHYLVRPTCVIIAMCAMGSIAWDYKRPENFGNLFICLCVLVQVMTTLITWRTLRAGENEFNLK